MENEDIVRIGTVTAVDAGSFRARVKYKDAGTISDWLPVLQQNTRPSETVECWLPNINDTVVVLYKAVFGGHGYIVGRLV